MSESAKQNLLEAACRVISERGVEGLTMQDTAVTAGVSKALLHYHYGSRRELILAAFEYSDDRAVNNVYSCVDPAGNGKQQLTDLLLAWASDDLGMQRHWIIWTEMWRWSMFEPELRRAVTDRHARFIASIAERIDLGKADVSTEEATRRLAACSDSFGDQSVVGIMTLGEVRVAMVRAIEHECRTAESTL